MNLAQCFTTANLAVILFVYGIGMPALLLGWIWPEWLFLTVCGIIWLGVLVVKVAGLGGFTDDGMGH
jgi:hypothetical protein